MASERSLGHCSDCRPVKGRSSLDSLRHCAQCNATNAHACGISCSPRAGQVPSCADFILGKTFVSLLNFSNQVVDLPFGGNLSLLMANANGILCTYWELYSLASQAATDSRKVQN